MPLVIGCLRNTSIFGASWRWVMKINSWWIYIVYSLPMFLVGILVMPHDVQKKSACIFLWILNVAASTRSRCCSEKSVVWTLFVPVVQHGVSSAVFYIGTKYVQKACKYRQHVVQSQCFFNVLFSCYYTKSTATIGDARGLNMPIMCPLFRVSPFTSQECTSSFPRFGLGQGWQSQSASLAA